MRKKINVTTKVIKIGNSQGVRLSRKDLDDLGIKIGDSIEIGQITKTYNTKQALQALHTLSKLPVGGFQDITDPVAWQREIRKDRLLLGRNDDITRL